MVFVYHHLESFLRFLKSSHFALMVVMNLLVAVIAVVIVVAVTAVVVVANLKNPLP